MPKEKGGGGAENWFLQDINRVGGGEGGLGHSWGALI